MLATVFLSSFLGSIITVAFLHWVYARELAAWSRHATEICDDMFLTDEERHVLERARAGMLLLASLETQHSAGSSMAVAAGIGDLIARLTKADSAACAVDSK